LEREVGTLAALKVRKAPCFADKTCVFAERAAHGDVSRPP